MILYRDFHKYLTLVEIKEIDKKEDIFLSRNLFFHCLVLFVQDIKKAEKNTYAKAVQEFNFAKEHIHRLHDYHEYRICLLLTF